MTIRSSALSALLLLCAALPSCGGAQNPPQNASGFVVNPDGFSAVQDFLARFWDRHLSQLRGALSADPSDPPQE